jgi:hypothetical protein
MWNFVVNNNGNTHDDIKKRFMNLTDACRKMQAAISDLHEVTNGRNYQTLPDSNEKREQDLLLVEGMMNSLIDTYQVAMSGAATAIRQREGL